MSESPKGGPQVQPQRAPTRRSPPVSWGAGRASRRNEPLKLLQTLRGRGVLVWAGGSVATTYEIDLYRRADTHSASGRLAGRFSGLVGAVEAAHDIRLRLEGGQDLAIELVALEPDFAEIEVDSPSLDAVLLAVKAGPG